MDPWGHFERAPCIPDLIDTDTWKFSTRMRQTGYIGTGGVGGVILSPSTGFSDIAVMGVTSMLTASVNMPSNVDAGITGVSDTQFPFLTASNAQYRLVACGLRVRYSGTELNRSGVVIPVSIGVNGLGIGGQSLAQILSVPSRISEPVKRKWSGCIWKSTASGNNDFRPAQLSSANQNITMAVAITGVPGMSFEVDVVRHWEVIPMINLAIQGTTPAVTKSESDITGYSYIREAVNSLIDSDIGQQAWVKMQAALTASAASFIASQTKYLSPSSPIPTIEWY